MKDRKHNQSKKTKNKQQQKKQTAEGRKFMDDLIHIKTTQTSHDDATTAKHKTRDLDVTKDGEFPVSVSGAILLKHAV